MPKECCSGSVLRKFTVTIMVPGETEPATVTGYGVSEGDVRIAAEYVANIGSQVPTHRVLLQGVDVDEVVPGACGNS
jgi:hypothetical protein